MGFYRQGSGWDFMWGHQVDEKLDELSIPSSDVVWFDRLKTCLLASEETEEYRSAIETCLRAIKGDVKDIHWLLRCYLESLREAILTATRETFSRYDIDNMRSEWFFAVPEMSTPTYIRTVTKAAKAAGFSDPIPVSETEAAAGWGVHLYLQEQSAHAPSMAKLKVW